MAEELPVAAEEEPTQQKERKRAFFRVFIWIALAIILVVAAILVVLFLLRPAPLQHLRDVSIVLIAILSSISILLLLILLAALTLAVQRLSERVDALLERGTDVVDRIKGTATTVKSTSDFVGEHVASPFIWVSSRAAGIGEGLRTLFGGKRNTGGSK